MKKKIISLTESDLEKIILRVIQEQTQPVPAQPVSTQPGNTVATAYSQGKNTGFAKGQQARQAVNKLTNQAGQAIKQGANAALKGITESTITIGKVTFKVITYGAAVVFLIGNSLFKVSQELGNAILKFIMATGRASVRKMQQLEQSTANSLKSAGVQIEKGVAYVGKQLSALQDKSSAVLQWVINTFKQFGTDAWAKVLVAAAGIQELNAMASNYLKSSWASIQNKIGVGWDQAANWASGAFKSIKDKASQLGNKISNKASEIGQGLSRRAGNVLGNIQGFLSEMYERYNSFSNNTLSILSEAKLFNGKVIL